MHIHVHTHTGTYAPTYAHMHAHTNTCTRVHMHTHTCTHSVLGQGLPQAPLHHLSWVSPTRSFSISSVESPPMASTSVFTVCLSVLPLGGLAGALDSREGRTISHVQRFYVKSPSWLLACSSRWVIKPGMSEETFCSMDVPESLMLWKNTDEFILKGSESAVGFSFIN